MNKCRSFCNIYFWDIFKKMLFAYMEKTLIGEKEHKVFIPLLIILKIIKKLKILSIYPRWLGLSQKAVSRYCPFN